MPKGIYGDGFSPADFSPNQLFEIYELDLYGDELVEVYTSDEICRLGFNTDDYGLSPVDKDCNPMKVSSAKIIGNWYWQENNPFRLQGEID